jgi:hypothetical protein
MPRERGLARPASPPAGGEIFAGRLLLPNIGFTSDPACGDWLPRMSTRTFTVLLAAGAVALAAAPAGANQVEEPTLEGRAILPADATAPAPFPGVPNTDPAPAPGST